MSSEDENLLAILGPTNTGKTFTAFEKLFTYSSGIFGFPLRLLARENYDKAVKRIGVSRVALITGEEKIYPKEGEVIFFPAWVRHFVPTNDCKERSIIAGNFYSYYK